MTPIHFNPAALHAALFSILRLGPVHVIVVADFPIRHHPATGAANTPRILILLHLERPIAPSAVFEREILDVGEDLASALHHAVLGRGPGCHDVEIPVIGVAADGLAYLINLLGGAGDTSSTFQGDLAFVGIPDYGLVSSFLFPPNVTEILSCRTVGCIRLDVRHDGPA